MPEDDVRRLVSELRRDGFEVTAHDIRDILSSRLERYDDTCTVCRLEYERSTENDLRTGRFEVKFTHVCPVVAGLMAENERLRDVVVARAKEDAGRLPRRARR